ncbi:hypothetical protein SCB29_39515, partial [Paraburkholderia sp. SIMBA_055]
VEERDGGDRKDGFRRDRRAIHVPAGPWGVASQERLAAMQALRVPASKSSERKERASYDGDSIERMTQEQDELLDERDFDEHEGE